MEKKAGKLLVSKYSTGWTNPNFKCPKSKTISDNLFSLYQSLL